MSRARQHTPALRTRRRATGALTGAIGAVLVASACEEVRFEEPPSAAATSAIATDALATTLHVDADVRYQRITGFGASSAWTGSAITDERADRFFSPTQGIGLSLLRMHISPDGTSSEVATAKRAAERGVSVWAAPWSPPGAWKTSGTDTNGGSLLPEYYEAWAERLAGFATRMADEGVPLVALSAQNEPNWTAEWETCVYTPGELTTFVRDYLGPALRNASPDTKLMAPETIDWSTIAGFANTLLADPDANAALGIIAVHAYGGTPFAYTAPAENGKEFWETEVSYNDTDLTSIDSALRTAREVERHLVVGGVNAFHYWWLVSDSAALMDATTGALTAQGYGLGHYSKFIRPGFVRIDVPDEPRAGLSVSAFMDPESHVTVVVVVNETSDEVPLSLEVDGVAPILVEPWVTDASGWLVAKTPVDFVNPLPTSVGPLSVTSFVLSENGDLPGNGEGGAAGASNGGTGADAGAAGAVETGDAGTGGTTSSGGTGARGGKGGTSSTSRGGKGGGASGGAAPLPSHAGSTGMLAAGSGNAAVPRKRGEYVACALVAGNATDGAARATPLFALTLLALRRRRRPASR